MLQMDGVDLRKGDVGGIVVLNSGYREKCGPLAFRLS